jgi:hypothetical protein
LIALALDSAQAEPSSSSEYSLKAVFLYNFVRFIDWPVSAFHGKNDPLVIGIVGPDPFGSLLYEAVAGESYHGRPIRVDHYNDPRRIGRCQLLFVGSVNADRLDQILAAVAGRNVLTVGETQRFLSHGGMIALTTEKNRVGLHINVASLQNTQLNVSSKLLQVAQVQY